MTDNVETLDGMEPGTPLGDGEVLDLEDENELVDDGDVEEDTEPVGDTDDDDEEGEPG